MNEYKRKKHSKIDESTKKSNYLTWRKQLQLCEETVLNLLTFRSFCFFSFCFCTFFFNFCNFALGFVLFRVSRGLNSELFTLLESFCAETTCSNGFKSSASGFVKTLTFTRCCLYLSIIFSRVKSFPGKPDA